MINESHQRTIVRAVTWRVVATLVTAIWTGLSGAIVINIFMTLAHYVHERAWLRVKWGIDGNEKKNNSPDDIL